MEARAARAAQQTHHTLVWLGAALVILVVGIALHTRFGDSFVGAEPLYRGAHASGSDDAYISYRYARNLLEGHGLVFNPGERVEGYTNPLYTLLMAPALALAGDHGIYTISVALNAGFVLAAMAVFFALARERLSTERAAVAALLFAATPSLWVAVSSGLETALVLLLQLALWLGAERASDRPERPHLLLLCAAAAGSTLVRADGFVFVAIVVLYLAARGCWRAALVCGATLLVSFGAHVAWRLSYYGYPLPNTYYAKVSGPLLERWLEGFKRLLRFGYDHYPSLALYLSAIGIGVIRALRTVRPEWPPLPRDLRFEFVMAPALLAYWIYVGGDYFGDRFLLVLYSAGILVALEAIGWLALARWRGLAFAGLLAIQLGTVLWSPIFTWRGDKYDYWIDLAAYLSVRHDDPVLAVDAAGKLPFFTRWRTIDMLGLNDESIAHGRAKSFRTPGHNKHDADYVLSRSPDLIAAWIHRDLDMKYGLDRERYEHAGYELAYLMNANLHRRERNVIEVSDLPESEIRQLFDEGYVYGVLVRAPPR